MRPRRSRRPKPQNVQAVQRYLQYLSMLVDVVLSGATSLAIHDNARALFMLQRYMIEYVAKAEYYDQHTDYALWAMTIGEAEDFQRRMQDGAVSDVRERLQAAVDTAKKAYVDHPAFRKIRDTDMLREIMGKESHTWLYRGPSVYIHGDPVGMRDMMDVRADGTVVGKIDFTDEMVNSLLVDLAGGVLSFCRIYQRNYTESNRPPLIDRLDALEKRLVAAIRKFPDDRDPEALEALLRSP